MTQKKHYEPGLCSEQKFKDLAAKWQHRVDDENDDFGKDLYTQGLAKGLEIAYQDAADRAAYNEKIEIERIMLGAL